MARISLGSRRSNPVAVIVTVGTPVAPADSVCGPVARPSVHPPTVARPSAPVVANVPVAAPPPLATTYVTPTPGTALSFASRATTAGAMGTGASTGTR